MDQGDLATRLSGINLSPPAASSTQGECGDVVRQRQDSVLYHQTPPASHDGKILADDPDMRLREVNGEWRLSIGDYDHPEICLSQVDTLSVSMTECVCDARDSRADTDAHKVRRQKKPTPIWAMLISRDAKVFRWTIRLNSLTLCL